MLHPRALVAIVAACHGGAAAGPDSADGDVRAVDAVSPDDAALDAALGSCPGGFAGACQAATQVPTQVTDLNTATGVTIEQLTSVGTNYITYYDNPAYSAGCGRVAFNRLDIAPRPVLIAAADGSDGMQLGASTVRGMEGVYLTPDGALAYWIGANADTSLDLYGERLGDPTCSDDRISQFALKAPASGSANASTASWDATARQWLIAMTVDTTLQTIHADGSNPTTITLQDPEATARFHRIRFNPRCPNLLMYRREDATGADGLPEVWVVDLDHPAQSYIANPYDASHKLIRAGHELWSSDGNELGFTLNSGAQFAIAEVATAGCTLALTNGEDGQFAMTKITPNDGTPVIFCTWAPDMSSLLCDNDCSKPPDRIFTMALDGTTALVTETGQKCGTTTSLYGQADAQYFGDAHHIVFTSNRTGVKTPQVYTATLP